MKQYMVAFLFIAFFLKVPAQYISAVYEYKPAPGQFINLSPMGTPEGTSSITGGISGSLALGSFGGYVVFGFEQPVDNHPDNPFGVDFTLFGNAGLNWSEPAIVYVMADDNRNGLPDDTWYELAGSDHFFTSTRRSYVVTYYNPGGNKAAPIPWMGSDGEEGLLQPNPFHIQPYYPQPIYFPAIDSVSYSLCGTRLPGAVDTTSPVVVNSYPRTFGYADNQPRGSAPYTLPDNPYTAQSENSGGDPFDISWAIDTTGMYVDLPVIDFVKVQSAVLDHAGWLGEISTEISGAIDVPPNPHIFGSGHCVVVSDLPLILQQRDYPLEYAVFLEGRYTPACEVVWSTNQHDAWVDNANVLHVSESGMLEISATLVGDSSVSTTVHCRLVLDQSVDDLPFSVKAIVYPCPAGGSVTLDHPFSGCLKLYSVSGAVMLERAVKAGKNTIAVDGLIPGVYYFRVYSSTQVSITPFIKK
ncbi:MAG: T9SS type A sorting domain-containing protein [Bacteroidales bacterium]|nr:T9SS type A sorting domain-containing protein [Bacteroidales bacterium]